jgi:hypothetical protein
MSHGSNRLAKKVALFKRIGFIDPDSRRIRTRRAITLQDLEAAYTLVHDVFHDKGYINEMNGGVRLRAFEALPEMATFVAEIGGQIVGVMSIVPDSPDLGLPSDKAFSKELADLRVAGRKVAEVTNLAIHKDYRNTGVFMSLAQPIVAHALSAGLDDIFIAISPGHAGFFEEVLQFEPWGGSRDYSSEKADTVEGKRWDLHKLEGLLQAADGQLGDEAFLHKHFFSENEFRQYVRPWAVIASRAFMDHAGLRKLFVDRSEFLQRCKPHELEAIHNRWGDAMFGEVFHGHVMDVELV